MSSALAGILVLALALRLIPLGLVLANGGSPLIGDEGNYVEAALSLAHGAGIPDRWLWIRPPGYIGVLAAIFRLSNDSLIAAQLAQIAISLVTIALTYVLVLRGVGGAGSEEGGSASDPRNPKSKACPERSERIQNPKSAALLAAAILALEPSLIFATGLFLTETLFLALLTALVGALLGYARATRPWAALAWAAAAGGLAGAALLTRASMTPLVLLALGAILARRRWPGRRRVAAAAVFALCLVLLLLPWTVRNARQYGRFLPVDTGGYQVVWTDNTDLAVADVRRALYRVPNPADRGNYALAQAAQWVLAHPDRFLARSAQRMVDSLAPDDYTQLGYPVRDKFPGRAAWERDAFSLGAWWGWVLLFGGALAGWLRAPRTALWSLAGGVVGIYILTGSLTHDEYRYRYQLFSLLAIYAAWAGLDLWHGLRRMVRTPRPPARAGPGESRSALLAGAVFVVWLLVTLPTFWPGFSRAVQAQQVLATAAAARAAGDLPRAQQAYATAARLERTTAAVRRDLGAVQFQQGQPRPAAATWTDALDQEPGDWRTRALLADLWRRLGQPGRAAAVARDVPPTFNGILLTWAWDHLDAPAPLTVTTGLDDVGWVRGFQIGEVGPDGRAYRWAGPDADSSIRLQGGQTAGARLTLVLNGLPQAPPLPAARPVALAANGQPLGTLQVAAGWAPYVLDLPAAVTADAPEIVLSFHSPPQQASAADPRYLSFALAMATIHPAP